MREAPKPNHHAASFMSHEHLRPRAPSRFLWRRDDCLTDAELVRSHLHTSHVCSRWLPFSLFALASSLILSVCGLLSAGTSPGRCIALGGTRDYVLNALSRPYTPSPSGSPHCCQFCTWWLDGTAEAGLWAELWRIVQGHEKSFVVTVMTTYLFINQTKKETLKKNLKKTLK